MAQLDFEEAAAQQQSLLTSLLNDLWKTEWDTSLTLFFHTGRSAVSSLVKSTTNLWDTPHHYEHNERSLAPQVHTQSAPKACPTPTIVPHSTHTHTMATLEPGVPLCNSITQRHTPVLIPSERGEKEWQRWQKKNCTPKGGMGQKTREIESVSVCVVWEWIPD